MLIKNNKVLVTDPVEHTVYSLIEILIRIWLNIFIDSNSK